MAERILVAGCRLVPALSSMAVLLALACGCGQHLRAIDIPNQPPTVRITQAPRDSHLVCPFDPVSSCYALDLAWSGFDPDGRVERYEFAIDPSSGPGADTLWQATRFNQHRAVFPSRDPIPIRGFEQPRAREFHVFVVRAVDNRGLAGTADARAFFSFTEAPQVQVSEPRPNGFMVSLASSVRVEWTGLDPDGLTTTRPVRYKYTLLSAGSEFSVDDASLFPDSLRNHYAPGFAGWDSVGGDTTWAEFTHLNPDQQYLFVVVAFDEVGAYSPIFALNQNMLWFRVSSNAALGPRITATSDAFEYAWRGEYCPCPGSELYLELPTGRGLDVSWTAKAALGASVKSFRWALDKTDLTDETPRRDAADLSRWSSAGLLVNRATLGPFTPSGRAEEHRLYIEALDNRGLKSLAVIRFLIVPPDLRRGTMLVVKDTRFKLDFLDRRTGCIALPTGQWPTQAELDTFLFARGGAPWRCYPVGTVSAPGLFEGYTFDTLGTRTKKANLTVPLLTMSHYEHVVWIVDQKSAGYQADGNDVFEPQTALRYMSTPGHFNTLAAYVKLGGKVWVVGGGGGLSSTGPFDQSSNNQPAVTFSNGRGELVRGRFMHDMASWRSEFRLTTGPALIRRYAGRHATAPDPSLPYTRYLGELPSEMRFRRSDTDPRPPNRSSGDYYVTTASLEFLLFPNHVRESADPESARATTLDSLYEGNGGGLPLPSVNPHNVLMTYYHGPSLPQGFVFTGFDVWTFRRADCKALVDFVLRRIWGLQPRRS